MLNVVRSLIPEHIDVQYQGYCKDVNFTPRIGIHVVLPFAEFSVYFPRLQINLFRGVFSQLTKIMPTVKLVYMRHDNTGMLSF